MHWFVHSASFVADFGACGLIVYCLVQLLSRGVLPDRLAAAQLQSMLLLLS